MKKFLISVFTVIACSSCATIVSGSSQTIKITSKSGQHIRVVDKYGRDFMKGEGSLIAELPKSERAFNPARYTVIVGNETKNIIGYPNYLYLLGDFFIPGVGLLFGGIIDGATGSIYDLKYEGAKVDTLDFK